MKTNTLSPDLLHKMDAHRRAANYLPVGQRYCGKGRSYPFIFVWRKSERLDEQKNEEDD